MARRRTSLVVQHAEMLDAQLFDQPFQGMLREFVKGKHGVYALYRGQRLYYVGLATNLRRRLNNHLKDRHAGKWNRFSLYVTDSERHLRELEGLVMRIAKPAGNKATTKLQGSKDLRVEIRRKIADTQRKERNRLVGLSRASRYRTRSDKRTDGDLPAAGLVDRATRIFLTYKGWEYEARLLKNGTIRYGRKVYDSPNEAAAAIVKRRGSGWRKWKVRVRGELVPLEELRR